MSWKEKMMAETPWIQSLNSLGRAYPTLPGIPHRLNNQFPIAKERVREIYGTRLPGRCALLDFREDRVVKKDFDNPQQLSSFLDDADRDTPMSGSDDESSQKSSTYHKCRLWILEDLEPEWVEVFGSKIGLDPAVIGEQMNTFNFLDSTTTQTRLIPSMTEPSRWFSMRYVEVRQTSNPENTVKSPVETMKNQMTLAMNPRRIEMWRDIDSKNFTQHWRHAFVRRSASFWTNQVADSSEGWDAAILVDPSYHSVPWQKDRHPDSPPTSTILQDPTTYPNLAQLWDARDWKTQKVEATADASLPYHGGSTTLTTNTLPLLQKSHPSLQPLLSPDRDLTSLFDELILHWTLLSTPSTIASARRSAVNTTTPLLRTLAVLWTNHLDLIQTTIAQSDHWDNDYQTTSLRPPPSSSPHGRKEPKPSPRLSKKSWESKLASIAHAADDIHYLRRQLHHFESHMALNLERLGIPPSSPSFSPSDEGKDRCPRAILDARRDFSALNARLTPMVSRAAALSGTAHEQVVLQATIKGISDGEFGVRLSLVGSVVFPMTLVAGMFSMGDGFLPGDGRFWVFWVVSLPLSAVLGVILIYGSSVRGWVDFGGLRRGEGRGRRGDEGGEEKMG